MAFTTVLLTVAWLAIIAALYLAVLQSVRLRRVRERLLEEHRAAFEPEVVPVPDSKMGWLRRWLFLAGFRRPEAPYLFTLFALVSLALGFLVAWTLRNSPLMDTALGWLEEIPGDVGTLFAPVLLITPWFLWFMIASLPWLHVRAQRRRRVREVDEDLPLTLQILATLARAGLGLDAALVRVLESSDPTRVLPQEMATFRAELMAGVSRTDAWRRLARRVEVPALGIFISAMVHSEQVGGGMSMVLEHQAEDVQSRRRENALVQAQALPVKLVFPLVLCFLPGIFIWTLGPAFYQFFEVIDGIMNSGGAGGI